MHNVAMHIGQAIVATLMAEGQLLVIDSQEMQTGCVEVVHMHFAFNDAETKLIGRSIG